MPASWRQGAGSEEARASRAQYFYQLREIRDTEAAETVWSESEQPSSPGEPPTGLGARHPRETLKRGRSGGQSGTYFCLGLVTVHRGASQ